MAKVNKNPVRYRNADGKIKAYVYSGKQELFLGSYEDQKEAEKAVDKYYSKK